MSNYKNLPAPSPENGLSRYLQEIRKFPMLEPEQEYMLAKRWIEEQDSDAAHQMVTSHLRLAAKIAMGYRGYGLPQAEVISLIECWLETGRTHQIRAHMAHLGHALIGDATYGRRKKISNKALNEDGFNSVNEFQRQALHASVLGFIHPLTGKQMKFSVDMPSDMQNLALGLKK